MPLRFERGESGKIDAGTAITGVGVLAVSAVLLGGGVKAYGDYHCAPWERGGRDAQLAYDAAQCAVRYSADHKGAEGHIDAIDDSEMRTRVDRAVDIIQGAEAVSRAYYYDQYDEAREIAKMVEDPSVRAEMARGMEAAVRNEDDVARMTWVSLYTRGKQIESDLYVESLGGRPLVDPQNP